MLNSVLKLMSQSCPPSHRDLLEERALIQVPILLCLPRLQRAAKVLADWQEMTLVSRSSLERSKKKKLSLKRQSHHPRPRSESMMMKRKRRIQPLRASFPVWTWTKITWGRRRRSTWSRMLDESDSNKTWNLQLKLPHQLSLWQRSRSGLHHPIHPRVPTKVVAQRRLRAPQQLG